MIFSTVKHSTHPLSKILYCDLADKSFTYPLSHFEEHPGAGLEAIVNDVMVKLGSQKFVGKGSVESEINKTRIYISFNNRPRGYFELKNSYRPSVVNLIKQLRDNNLSLELLSGDNEGEKEYLISLFGKDASLKFNQSPMDKLMAIRELQKRGKNVLMVGDGLNDAGALKQSDVGISVSDDINNFSPASDAILSSDNLSYLNKFISMSVLSRKIIIISFCISLLYNLVGLSYALQGTLSPLVAAILMPISSVSIIVFTSSITNIIAKRRMNDLH